MEAKKSQSIAIEIEKKLTTKTFNGGWSLMRMMVVFFGVMMVITILASVVFAYQSNQAALERVFVITGDATLIAKSALNDIRAREIEVRSHVKLFMSSMYAFDERNFEKNIERGLHLIGNDGALILMEYRKAKTHEELIKSNGTVSIEIDSIWTGMEAHPYKARVFARQKYTTSVQEIESVIWADMNLRNAASRSEHNVAGLIIENFNLIKNQPVSR